LRHLPFLWHFQYHLIKIRHCRFYGDIQFRCLKQPLQVLSVLALWCDIIPRTKRSIERQNDIPGESRKAPLIKINHIDRINGLRFPILSLLYWLRQHTTELFAYETRWLFVIDNSGNHICARNTVTKQNHVQDVLLSADFCYFCFFWMSISLKHANIYWQHVLLSFRIHLELTQCLEYYSL